LHGLGIASGQCPGPLVQTVMAQSVSHGLCCSATSTCPFMPHPLSVGLHVTTVSWQHPKNEHRVFEPHCPTPTHTIQHYLAHIADRCSSCGTPNRAQRAPKARHSTPCSTVACRGAVLARADRRRQNLLSETQLLLRMLCAAAKKHAARAAMPLLHSGSAAVLDQAKPCD
jgi:hypothetical protein